MADPAAPQPQKSPSPLRWVLVGCGVLTGLFLLGMGGCAGIFIAIFKASDGTAQIGANYLRNAPEMQRAMGGEEFSVKRNWMGWNVSVVNDGGHARFEYAILGPQGGPKGGATVLLNRSGGKWSVVGARVRPDSGDPFTIGRPSAEQRTDLND